MTMQAGLLSIHIHSHVFHTVENDLQIEVCGAMALLDQHILAIVAFDMIGVFRELLPQNFDYTFGNGVLGFVVGY